MAVPQTFQDLQLRVIAKARLDSTADLAAVKDWLNLVYMQACLETEALQATGTFSLVAGTSTYDLSTLVSGNVARIKVMYVTSGGVASNPIRLTGLDEIVRRRSSGGTAAQTGGVAMYALDGLTNLEFYPTPASADTVTIWYVKLPTALSANADVHVLGEPFSQLLVYGAAAEAADFKGDPAVNDYRALYESWLGRLRSHLRRRAGGQPGAIRWFPETPFVPHDPSTDWVVR